MFEYDAVWVPYCGCASVQWLFQYSDCVLVHLWCFSVVTMFQYCFDAADVFQYSDSIAVNEMCVILAAVGPPSPLW